MDKTVLGDVGSLPEEDQIKMSAIIDRLQTRDSLRLYNSVVERCFNECVDTFWRKSLGKQEEKCVLRCVQKHLKLSPLVGAGLAELNDGPVLPRQ